MNKKLISNPVFFQPKLAVNETNDVYEQESDVMADTVMRMRWNTESLFFFSAAKRPVQRKCSHCEEEKKLLRKDTDSPEATSYKGLENYVGSLGTSGNKIPDNTRTFFETRMGYDFSNVRIHTNADANISAKSINALAYTHHNNIVFNKDQYAPDSGAGKRLLAHELTHVVQQSSAGLSQPPVQLIQREPGKNASELDDDQLKSEYDSYNEYIHSIPQEDYTKEEDNMNYFVALEAEMRKRCIKAKPSHPKEVSQKLIDRITGKYASIDGDPGEGLRLTPYVASEGQCTIGYGHVIYPKSSCTITTETTGDGKEKKSCNCAGPWNAITKDRAIGLLKEDLQTHMNHVHDKIKVDLNQAEFDAMVDLSAHRGSLPDSFITYVHENWCTNKDAVRNKYLKTAITMKDPDTKKDKVMKNFVERRKKRVW